MCSTVKKPAFVAYIYILNWPDHMPVSDGVMVSMLDWWDGGPKIDTQYWTFTGYHEMRLL